METANQTPHPYHYWEDKSALQHLIDWFLPIGLFLLYFLFYNFGKFTVSEMIKTTGLVAITLLSSTLFVGSISRFFPVFNILKAHRKFWGISSFVFALIHGGLVFALYSKFNLFTLLNPASDSFWGVVMGLVAVSILFVVTISSLHFIMTRLPPGAWKKLQMTSYFALTLAIAHFYLMEQKGGILVIKRSLGQMTFWFATIVILLRIIVFLFPKKEPEQNTHPHTS